MLIHTHFYSWLYKESTVQDVDVMPDDGTARVKVIISNSAFGRYRNLFPSSKIFVAWNPSVKKDTDLIKKTGIKLVAWMLESLFLNQLMLSTRCTNGRWFRKLLFENNSFELHSGSKSKDSSNFYVGIVIDSEPQMWNHRMASKLTFRKTVHHIKTLIPFFRIKYLLQTRCPLVIKKWKLMKKTLLPVYK